MEITATDFRKNLFQTLDRALKGEPVDISYKGSKLRLHPTQPGSRLARLIPRPTLLVDFDRIVGPDPEIVKSLEKKWGKKYPKR